MATTPTTALSAPSASGPNKTQAYAASGQPVEEYLEDLLDSLDKRQAVGVCLRPSTPGKAGEYIFAGWAAE